MSTIEEQIKSLTSAVANLESTVSQVLDAVKGNTGSATAGSTTAPAASVDLTPVLDAVAALDAKVTTVLADITDTDNTQGQSDNTGSGQQSAG